MATDNSLSLTGLNKAAVLAALYNASKPQGLGFLHYDPTPMTVDEAKRILDGGATDFDYLKGRVMKIDLSGDALNPRSYDRDNGQGAAERAIAEVRKGMGEVNSPQIQKTHREKTQESAADMRQHLNEESRWTSKNTLQLGAADVKDKLGPAINKAIGHSNQ